MAENKKNLFQKLQEVQSQIKVFKDQKVAYGNTRYSFRSLEQIIAELKPILEFNGLYMKQSDEVVEIGGRLFVKVTSEVYDAEDEKYVDNTSYAEIDYSSSMNMSQKTGSASSYARKYGLCGLFGIEGEPDADQEDQRKGQARTNTKAQQSAEKTISKMQMDELMKMPKTQQHAFEANEILKKAGYSSVKDIKVSEYKGIYEAIKKACGGN